MGAARDIHNPTPGPASAGHKEQDWGTVQGPRLGLGEVQQAYLPFPSQRPKRPLNTDVSTFQRVLTCECCMCSYVRVYKCDQPCDCVHAYMFTPTCVCMW
jgi:hypothetical protein